MNGPPIITQDGLVLGGNNRSMRILNRYDEDGYKAALDANLASRQQFFGVSRDALPSMKRPEPLPACASGLPTSTAASGYTSGTT